MPTELRGQELLRVRDVARILFGASQSGERTRVRRLIRSGALGAVKLGPDGKTVWWIPRKTLKRYIEKLREDAELSDPSIDTTIKNTRRKVYESKKLDLGEATRKKVRYPVAEVRIKLRQARKRSGLFAAGLARKLEMSPNSYRSVENGHRELKFALAVKIAKVLGVPISDLIDASEIEAAGGLQEGGESAELVRTGASDLPIYGRSQLLMSDVEMVETGSFIERPSVVAQAQGAYALRVFDNRAAPRYDVGDILIVDPDRAPTPNQWCVVTLIKGENLVAEIHRVVQIDRPGRRIVIAEARPDGEDYIGLAVIKSVDVIVGTQLA